MKLVTMTAAATLLIAAASSAYAQNQPTTNVEPPPNAINHGAPHQSANSGRSGAESEAAAQNRGARIIGRSRYCTEARDHVLRCHYRTMASCEKSGRHGNLACVANPAMATGAAPMAR